MLPIYELKINESLKDDSEVSVISFVDEPAIMKDFLMFRNEFIEPSKGENEDDFIPRCISYVVSEGKDQDQAAAICYSIWEEHFADKKPKQTFQIVNEEQRIVSGPLMVADQLIYRNNDKMGEHYVKFSSETIKQIAIKFSKKKYQMNVNLMHDPKMQVEGVTMFESFIVDKKRGILPMEQFKDVADGSWFGSFYVENPDVWNAVKKGELRGFSVEGLFQYDEPTTPEEQALKKISALLNELID
jgi:hypothetical protein